MSGSGEKSKVKGPASSGKGWAANLWSEVSWAGRSTLILLITLPTLLVVSAYFALLIPGEHHDYLVCTECGSIKSIDMSCPVKKLEKDIMKSSGFTRVYHELEFYGVCPKCA